MGTSNCMSQKAQEKFKNYVRLDYHGVILVRDIYWFPIITTFRGLGWMGTSNCLSQKAQEKFKNYVRLDYHGVILVRDIYFLLGFFF